MAIRRISAELIPLTRDLAVSHSTMQPMDGERELSLKRVDDFTTLIEEGGLCAFNWVVAIVKGATTTYRADGQHTSYALAHISDDKFPQNLNVVYQVFEIDSIEEDAAVLFDMFDNPKSARSNVDAMGIYVTRHPDIAGLDREFVTHITSGIHRYLSELAKQEQDATKRPITHSPARLHGLYLENEQYRAFTLLAAHSWGNTKNQWMLNQASIVAEIVSDWLTQPDKAITFWTDVFTEQQELNHLSREIARSFNDTKRKSRIKRTKEYSNIAKKGWIRFCRMENGEAKAA